MHLVFIKMKPVDRQASWCDKVNEALRDAVDAVIYTTPAHNQGEGEMTINIFALCKD